MTARHAHERAVRGHWLVLGLAMTALFALLTFHNYTHADALSGTSTTGAPGSGPIMNPDDGLPVMTGRSGGMVRSRSWADPTPGRRRVCSTQFTATV